ncbi:hypothetical protein T265_11845 [Opisthorchis viverrini]|uniref:Uncharacterized protein n=1 Tax=Opisthorchis viverrini TaxID=6198 RepID=A0A074YX21_OPIVI|nr:hypothetical protein T265_11845 [Opisthorchis viverrini]KER19356.1 hypothetical protein T265_11845 [Opisthorchis viverrini]
MCFPRVAKTTLMNNIVITSLVGRYFKSGVSIKWQHLDTGFHQAISHKGISRTPEMAYRMWDTPAVGGILPMYLIWPISAESTPYVILVINKLFINSVKRIEIGPHPVVLHGSPEYTCRHVDSSKVVQHKCTWVPVYYHKS